MDTLQSKINDALVFDQQKTQVNDAKLRAVAQRVDYDDFVKMVAGAHLKPVKPCSKETANISKPFDFFVMPKYEKTAASLGAGPALPAAGEQFTAPKDGNEFLRIWRRKCKPAEAKLRYLRTIDPDELPMLFRAEMDPAVLDGIAEALRAGLLEDTGHGNHAPSQQSKELAVWAGRLLLSMARINRFELTLELAETSTTRTLSDVFDYLECATSLSDETGGSTPCFDIAALNKLRSSFKL
eukprot:CAMPEP_0119335748 /NCGR_PEP_ID=MMETSP1333-20130426/90239_1 /TAXON_ID=418940 /ORGANISM="Scyphosphaera apsteinii, Strain RCC1455" /LENGTH=239 /DNA_ID=CAMNT_0007346387 /DNA_START=23 /DNA_END=742 /DNA_ORIENTATION=+